MGYRRARAEMRRMADHFDAEIASLQDDFAEIAVELRHARDLDEAIIERATSPDELLH